MALCFHPPPMPRGSVVVTVRQKILAAAVFVEQYGGVRRIDADDLVVAAWRLFPGSFSLARHDLPHSNRVLSKLSGRDGLVEAGLVTRDDEGFVVVTPKGRDLVARLYGVPLRPPRGDLTSHRHVEVAPCRQGAAAPSIAHAVAPSTAPVTAAAPAAARARSRRRWIAPTTHFEAPRPAPVGDTVGWWTPPAPQRFVGSPNTYKAGLPVAPGG